jgi:hypothetical protein
MSIPSFFTPDKFVYLSSKYRPSSEEDKFVSLNQLESDDDVLDLLEQSVLIACILYYKLNDNNNKIASSPKKVARKRSTNLTPVKLH